MGGACGGVEPVIWAICGWRGVACEVDFWRVEPLIIGGYSGWSLCRGGWSLLEVAFVKGWSQS